MSATSVLTLTYHLVLSTWTGYICPVNSTVTLVEPSITAMRQHILCINAFGRVTTKVLIGANSDLAFANINIEAIYVQLALI